MQIFFLFNFFKIMNLSEALKNKIYGITSRKHAPHGDVFQQVKNMIDQGVKIIQYRDKDVSDSEFFQIAQKLKKIIPKEILFIINDRWQIAGELKISAVHLGQEDLLNLPGQSKKMAVLRHYLKKKTNLAEVIIGISTHSWEEAFQAEQIGGDYIGVGALYFTSSKDNVAVIKKHEVSKILQNIKIPKVAIGGINFNNYQEFLKKGFDSVAMMSALSDTKPL